MSIDRDPAGTKPLGMAGPWASRRQLLLSAGGLGPLSLLDLLLQDPASAAAKTAAAGRCHFAPKARSVIMLFCPGGVSQVDTYDHKPELERLDGKKFDRPGEFFAKSPTVYRRSHFPFTRHGQCGRPLSSLFPRLGQCVDDMAFIHSMTVHSAIHGPATFLMNTGFAMPGFPAMGAWMSYGLGRETDNLPTFVVLPDPRGLPPGGPRTWGAGFLPAIHQGTALATESGRDPIADLFAPQGAKLDAPGESATRNFLRQLNQLHLQQRSGNSDLAARIAAYEMAARLQLSAPEATDLGRESPATRQSYGLDRAETQGFGRQCLLARRLVERGVRFVQVFCGADNTSPPRPNWDAHEDIVANHGRHGPVLDVGASALIQDLKARGMLDQTLVICTSEFGRQPAQQGTGKGRDHNPDTFTNWLAGGGIRPGFAYGQSDEIGYKVGEKPVTNYDLHATLLHLLGIDHTRLTYYHNGIERRLTDVHGHVVRDLIA